MKTQKTVQARLKLFPAEAGGYPTPIEQWPFRIMVRFDTDKDLNFGAVILSGPDKICPGEVVHLEIAFLDDLTTQKFISEKSHFHFGDLRDRGEGWIL